MVSKGGSFTSAWMLENGRVNPFRSRFDEICGVLAEGDVVAFRIAARIGDALKYGRGPEDKRLAEYRRTRDWENLFGYAIDGDRARQIHSQDGMGTCTMCGKYCAIAIMENYLR